MISSKGSWCSAMDMMSTMNKFKVMSVRYRMTECRTFTFKYSISKKILIVGLNPSMVSVNNSPLHPNTKTRKKVDSWFKDESTLFEIKYMNLSDIKTKDKNEINKDIKDNQSILLTKIDLIITKNYKVISLGNDVDCFLTKNKIEHFAMPHPSGLNRFWNDPIASKEKVNEMLDWITK